MFANIVSQSFPKLLKTVAGKHRVVAIITRRTSTYEIPPTPREVITAQHKRYCSSSPGLLGKFQEMSVDSGKRITRVLFCGPYFPASHNFTREYLQSYPFVEVDAIPLDDVSDVIGNYDICVVKSIDIRAATRHGIKVARIPSNGTGNASSCAEMAIYLMLGLLRKQNEIQVAVREKNLGDPVGDTLLGKTVFILGFGNIGFHLAKRLRPFGVKILATKRSWPSPSQSSCQSDVAYIGNGTHDDLVDEKGGREDILNFASRADIVVCCLLMNNETAGIVDKGFMRSMKKGALLVNIARGGLFDYDAVLHNLESGDLGGLGIDVAWTEPFDPDDPVLKFPNVIYTPHIAGVTECSYRFMAKVVGDVALQLHAGKPLTGIEIVN